MVWRSEPFRVFFPLGVLLAWVGVGHWLLYATGLSTTFSCFFHGVVQMQAFMMAFAVGFLLTAVPRRTQTTPVSVVEMAAIAVALVATTASALAEQWAIAQVSYLVVFLVLLQFALRRFVGRAAGRRPPAAFVLIPIGVLHGLAGAVLIVRSTWPVPPLWAMSFGRLLVQQGVFLCFAVGVGSLVLPLMSGTAPPADFGASPRERRRALAYGLIGMTIFASLVLEQVGWERVGPLLRAAVVAAGLGLGAGAWQKPGKPGVHRQLVWVSTWLMPAGLVASAVFPDYRIAALHILFIGGFGLMAFGVATHVALSHLDLQDLALGRPRAIIYMGAAFALALMARVAADMSHSYFDHLGWAAALWLAGSALWLGFLGPKLLRRTSGAASQVRKE